MWTRKAGVTGSVGLLRIVGSSCWFGSIAPCAGLDTVGVASIPGLAAARPDAQASYGARYARPASQLCLILFYLAALTGMTLMLRSANFLSIKLSLGL